MTVAGLLVWHEDASGSGSFLFQDQLGSIRVTASASGTVEDDVDYESFGTLCHNYGSSPSDNNYWFTGDEADSESSSDYAVFRSLGQSMGRFNRPDPYYGSYDWSNPQSLNRYGYALDNPLAFVDPLGLVPVCSGSETWSVTAGNETDSGSDDYSSVCTLEDNGGGIGGSPNSPLLALVVDSGAGGPGGGASNSGVGSVVNSSAQVMNPGWARQLTEDMCKVTLEICVWDVEFTQAWACNLQGNVGQRVDDYICTDQAKQAGLAVCEARYNDCMN